MTLVLRLARRADDASAQALTLRSLVLLVLLFAPCAHDARAQATPQAQATPSSQTQATQAAVEIRLARVEFVGLERYRQEDALSASGLQVGQVVDETTLDAAAERLMQSGLFKTLTFSFRAAKGQGTVTFKVSETSAPAPVVFDNFVWFTEDELRARVRSVVPTFDGTAPQAGPVTDAIRKALTDLLRERNISGNVEYLPPSATPGERPEHVFSVRGAGLRVCQLKYLGARAVDEKTLIENSSGIFNNEYSRAAVLDYAAEHLLAFYYTRGHLRAAFRAPRVKPVSTDDCKDGLSLEVPVDEGIAYVWDGAEWTGNTELTAAELDRALGMPPKVLVDGTKIDKGMESVARAYARKGYLAVRVTRRAVFDDEGRRVRFRFEVEEGPQYRMGQLTLTGLPEQDSNMLRGRWRILSREPYDAEYVKEFIQKEAPDVLKRAAMEKRVPANLAADSDVRLDRENLTVDVTVNFKEKKP
ncbi:MAG TPA: POTRA domain-containing protein [Pyrinomonadaceae bacterium]|nr:POTRA domain-containing protein [Pyrinomonadaceae bacterium]